MFEDLKMCWYDQSVDATNVPDVGPWVTGVIWPDGTREVLAVDGETVPLRWEGDDS